MGDLFRGTTPDDQGTGRGCGDELFCK